MHCTSHLVAASCAALLLLAAAAAAQSAATAQSGLQPGGKLIELDEDNWHLMLQGEWMIEFFAPWCPACKNLAPTWERFARVAKDVHVQVAKIDVTTSPSLSGRFFVTALPTIYHVKDGEFRQYRGARDGDALLYFVKKQQWQSIEPLSAWKKPDTIHMSVLSYFFKLSHTLKHTQKLFKDFNGRLQEEYGLPTWGSYALFAIATIFVGAALGLLLVCLVDFVYPPKKSQRQSFSESQDNLTEGLEDLATEEIEDDGEAENEDEQRESDEEPEENEDDEEEEDDSEEQAGDLVAQEKETDSEPEKAEKPEPKQVGDSAPEKTEQVRKRKPRKGD
ncbi:thioredoxin-related transmembrane protein 1 isoform X1 [Drosophila subpulchrella]|uniref:thioredoxin-related transmembrane protein 1 isoform X1 n=1 Tax=Drosophila subpulchrella TaxID=1486046 RepID=UPI0018A1696E|nr:thioredoxin-related transmembrane protein 1 isoform X1 [Drosophila subpulchrella]